MDWRQSAAVRPSAGHEAAGVSGEHADGSREVAGAGFGRFELCEVAQHFFAAAGSELLPIAKSGGTLVECCFEPARHRVLRTVAITGIKGDLDGDAVADCGS